MVITHNIIGGAEIQYKLDMECSRHDFLYGKKSFNLQKNGRLVLFAKSSPVYYGLPSSKSYKKKQIICIFCNFSHLAWTPTIKILQKRQ